MAHRRTDAGVRVLPLGHRRAGAHLATQIAIQAITGTSIIATHAILAIITGAVTCFTTNTAILELAAAARVALLVSLASIAVFTDHNVRTGPQGAL